MPYGFREDFGSAVALLQAGHVESQTDDGFFEFPDAHVKSSNDRLQSRDARIQSCDARFQPLDARFEPLDASLQSSDSHLQAVEAAVDSVEVQLPTTVAATAAPVYRVESLASKDAVEGVARAINAGGDVAGQIDGCTFEVDGINDRGTIVGYSGTRSGPKWTRISGPSHAWVWQNGRMTDIGGSSRGDSFAYGVNDAGIIVGCAGANAARWVNKRMQDLNALIDPQSGWHLTCARAINRDGVIVGTGMLGARGPLPVRLVSVSR